jgi:hypothetical protein
MSKFLENTIVPENSNPKIMNFFKYEKKEYENPVWVNTLKQMNNDSNVYYLTNMDFKRGTFRIKSPGRYVLSEDIVFNPNPENNFQPYSYQKTYYNKFTYALGFFAAITIESDNVTIDLNNHSIQQSSEHYKNQRFYANIELGNSPFTPNNGPANFGNVFFNCNNIVIENGSLKLSSHHGIHGNNSSNLVFRNLIIDEYEVGGISLNGCNNIVCDNITLETINSVNFNHKLVHLIICKPILEKLSLENPNATIHNKTINELINEMNYVIKNESGIAKNMNVFVDGNAYGLSFNGEGPVIGSFKTNPINYTAYNIFLNNITIKSIKTAVEEVPGYKREYKPSNKQNKGYNKNIQKGPIAQVLDVKMINKNNTYCRNILADIQFILAKYSVIGSIDDCLIKWVDENKEIIISENRFIYGIDNMNHVMKGNIGIFFSNVKDGIIQNINVEEMINNSPLKHTISDAHNNNAIAVIGSKNIQVKNVISKIQKSIYGDNKLLLIK